MMQTKSGMAAEVETASGQTPEEYLLSASVPITRMVKDVIERCAAAVLLAVLAPVLVLIAVLVRITSPGPVIFRRRVLGVGGVPFDAFKFRTMVKGADRLLSQSAAHRFHQNMKLRDDPRLTPLGRLLRKSSLDELPQLLNVLRGEMSLVGPRMIAPEELPKYGRHIPKRLSVKPGITGLWQVSGRQELDYATRVELDVHYIDNWSLWLDLVIVLRTIPTVLSMRGAF
jgi:lipopolysaccharide/colanic/teichoic acid biosynthesis glycosyltransferase